MKFATEISQEKIHSKMRTFIDKENSSKLRSCLKTRIHSDMLDDSNHKEMDVDTRMKLEDDDLFDYVTKKMEKLTLQEGKLSKKNTNKRQNKQMSKIFTSINELKEEIQRLISERNEIKSRENIIECKACHKELDSNEKTILLSDLEDMPFCIENDTKNVKFHCNHTYHIDCLAKLPQNQQLECQICYNMKANEIENYRRNRKNAFLYAH